MKWLLFVLICLPVLALGQYDLDSRYFTMDAQSLPDTQELSSFDIDFGEERSFKKMHITDFNRVTSQNYWQAVDMSTALAMEQNVSTPGINLPKLNQKEFGFSVSVNGSNSFDGTSSYGVRNSVYRESRSVYFCAPSGGLYVNRRRNQPLFRY